MRIPAVLIQVEYEIDVTSDEDFISKMKALEEIRRRDGPFMWALFVDPRLPGRYLEKFMVESWLEHLRQHERVTVSDGQIQEQVNAFHCGKEPPRVTHYLAEERVRHRTTKGN